MRRKSYCCILLDEIEKAHPDVFNLLLQIFDDGHLTDAKGRRVDFRNSIIVMTSNVGADLISRGTVLGFASRSDESKTREQSYEKMKTNLLDELKKTFRPEFLNRVDSVVVFHSLSKEQIRQIVDLVLTTVNQQLSEKNIKLEVTDAAKDFLGEKGYDEVYGARPLRRVIQDMIEDKLSESLLRQEFKTFAEVFEIKATIKQPGAVAGIIEDIKGIPGILSAESSEDLLTIFSTKSIKFDVEKIIKEALQSENEGGIKDRDILKPRIAENSYVSYVVVDVKDNEIVVESKDGFILPIVAVGALAGDDK